MNRIELAKEISKRANLSVKDAENLINSFQTTVTDALAKDDRVVFSNFGTFYTVHYPSKVIYHPRLGAAKKIIMLPTNAAKWMPSGSVKEAVLRGSVDSNATMHGSRKKFLGLFNMGTTDAAFSKAEASTPASERMRGQEEYDIPIKTSSKKTKNDEAETSPLEDDSKEYSIPIATNGSGKGHEEQGENSTGIYEEKIKGGGQEETTFDGVIKLHERPSFIKRFFSKKAPDIDPPQEANPSGTDTSEEKPRVSLVDSGIFGKSLHDNLAQPQIIQKPEPETEQKTGEEVSIPINTSPMPAVASTSTGETPSSAGFSFHQGYAQTPEEKNEEEPALLKSETKKNISFIDLSEKPIDKKVLQKIPERVARRYKLAPVEENENEFVIAMVDPEDIEAIDIIRKYVQKTVITKLASEEDINRVLDQYNGLESELKDAIEIANNEDQSQATETGEGLIESASDSAPAARIVASILRRAIREKASDIHIEPSETEVEIRFRIDGILIKKVVLPKKLQAGAISRIKILSSLKIDEQRLPQDGRFSITIDDRKVDFRVSTMPVAYGEKVVMRILDKLTGILTIDQLGIRGKARETLDDNLKKTHGMILVTGPTGSGKTTTLYALISHLFSEGVNIVTLEDPIEYQITGINQSQVNPEINYTFASGLRSIVRQDPDIIMIGEIRDGETADMAIHAALTGHIVLSTLHTNNAAGAAPRLIDMQIEPFLLNSSLNMVLGQRLARALCDNCKKEIALDEGQMAEIQAEIAKMPEQEKSKINLNTLKFYAPGGCEKCGKTGYKGRIGLYEVLGVSEEIKTLILKKDSSEKIEEEAQRQGMITMFQDGILKAIDGVTTLDEVWRVTKE